jgi:hypothetical protein
MPQVFKPERKEHSNPQNSVRRNVVLLALVALIILGGVLYYFWPGFYFIFTYRW